MSWTFVAHVHTRRSFDSMTSPSTLVREAVRRGIDVLAITDHDTWQGAVDALDVVANTRAPLRIVVASEVATEQGDVIGLFLRDDHRQRSATAFCDAVHDHGGLVLLPHPYKWHRLDEALLQRVDLVEVFNGRTPRADNERAVELARTRGLPGLVGPDAHRLGELGLACNVFDGDLPDGEAALKRALLETPRTFHTRLGSPWNEWRSQGVRMLKDPDPNRIYHWLRGTVRRVVKPGAYRLT